MGERVAWVVLALIHTPPFAALFFPALITRLYAVERGAEAFPLLQHRAALFGVVVIACLWAALDASVARLAVVVTALSMLSFLAIYLSAGAPASLRSIALADLVGLPFLLWVAWRAYLS